MTDIVEKNRLDWEEYSEKYQAFNLSDSILERLKQRRRSWGWAGALRFSRRTRCGSSGRA